MNPSTRPAVAGLAQGDFEDKTVRKPENREKFKKIISTMTEFYGKRDAKMVVEVLEEETAKAKELEVRRELKRMRMKAEEELSRPEESSVQEETVKQGGVS
jgi:uncharacterized membrane-anchored protein YjiN (DUF445 family)